MHARTRALAAVLAPTLALGLAACSPDGGRDAADPIIDADRCAANEAAGPITFLTSFGYAASVGILDVLAAEEQGYFEQLCLDVTLEPGSANTQLVSAGTAQFAGIGGASDVLVARDNGAELEAVAVYGNQGAIELLTMADSGIDEIADFAGATIGYKEVVPPQFQAMLQGNGVDLDSIEWVSVGYDPSILPAGQVDALAAYKSNEPLVLRDAGHDIVEWDPDDLGVPSTFNAQVVNTGFAEEHPTAVEDFLRASLAAYAWITADDDNLDAALAWAQARSDAGYDTDVSKARWLREVELVTESLPEGWALGWMDEAQWQPEAEVLARFALIGEAPDLAAAFDTSYLQSALGGASSIVWPVDG